MPCLTARGWISTFLPTYRTCPFPPTRGSPVGAGLLGLQNLSQAGLQKAFQHLETARTFSSVHPRWANWFKFGSVGCYCPLSTLTFLPGHSGRNAEGTIQPGYQENNMQFNFLITGFSAGGFLSKGNVPARVLPRNRPNRRKRDGWVDGWIDFKELAHIVVESGKLNPARWAGWLGTQEKPMLQFKSKAHWLEKFLLLGGGQSFVLSKPSTDRVSPTHIIEGNLLSQSSLI